MVWRGSRKPTPRRISLALQAIAANPVTVIRALPGELRQWTDFRRNRQIPVDDDWEEHLHELLGAPWPCPEGQQLDELMADIGELLAGRGLNSGRLTYGWYSDAESSLCRAVWCTVRHTRPAVVVETGVAHGVTSRVVLEGLRRNDFGQLWSIDLPFPFDSGLHAETGIAVTEECRSRWTYLEGTSKQRMPPLVRQLGQVQLFIHDSLHTAKNVVFEMEQAASVMPVGGVMLIDDIRSHDALPTFARQHPGYQTLACDAEDRKGSFGIAVRVS
jgi:methyltransferase family protein